MSADTSASEREYYAAQLLKEMQRANERGTLYEYAYELQTLRERAGSCKAATSAADCPSFEPVKPLAPEYMRGPRGMCVQVVGVDTGEE